MVARVASKAEWVSSIGAAGLGALLRSCRFSVAGTENFRQFTDAGKPVIFVLWHGRLLPCTFRHRNEGLVTLISQHRDGEYIAGVVRRWGFTAVRGSSSRGGTPALRALLRHLRGGRSLAITPDGPRGPRETMKPGVLLLARLSGAPIVPVLAGTDRAWWFGSWDRFLVPKPFAAVRMIYGSPIRVPPDADDDSLPDLAHTVEARLGEIMRAVDGARAA